MSSITSIISRRHLLACAAVLACSPASAIAQAYPDRPITVFSIFGPGSPQDAVVRALCDIVSKDLKQPVVVDPKMGAGGAIGATAMLAQKADGYALSMNVTPAFSTLPLMQKLSYDPGRDFTYIIQLASFPLGIATKAESPFKSWADLVQHAKANPGKVTYGTPGVGSLVNLGMQRLQAAAGISLTHVPHQNPMEIVPAVLGEHVQLMASGTEWKANAEAGKMRVLVTFGEKRLPSFPNVPTLREAGYDFDLDVAFGLVAPKGIDPATAKTLHDAFKRALESATVKPLFEKFDLLPAYATGEAFQTRMAKIGQDFKPLIEQLGLAKKD